MPMVRYYSFVVGQNAKTHKRERSMLYTKKESKIINEALAIVSSKFNTSADILTSSALAKTFVRLALATLEHEVFMVVYLSNQHQVIATEELFRGTIDGASVHPREVVKAVLAHNAAAVIFSHNHPSAVAEPSQADITITRRLVSALELIEVRVIDHIIVAGDQVVSMSERGLL